MSRLVRGGRVTWTRDVLRDVLVEMGARRSRSVLAVVAVALSVGALLASVGLSRAAARQVDADLAAATLDMVTVTVAHASGTDAEGTTFPSDAPARVTALAPVVGAGLRIDVSPLRATSVTRAPVAGSDPQDAGLLVSGMTSGYLEAAQADAGPGARWLDHEEPVVLLGVRAAAALHVPVTDDPRGLSVWVDGRRHDVVGFLDEGRTDLERVVAIPYRGAVRSVGGDREARMLIRSVPGAGAVVADVARLAIRPDAPAALAASPVLDTSTVRAGVSSRLGRLVGWVGALLLALSVLLISGSMAVGVLTRTPEIGLRRALGASRGTVAAVFLVEGAVTGALGGLTGAALTAWSVTAAAAASGWTAGLDAWWVVVGPALGAAVGTVSAVRPALRAAAIEPALAVRSS